MRRIVADFDAVDFRSEVTSLKYFTAAQVNAMVNELPTFTASLTQIPPTKWEADEMEYAQEYWKANLQVLPAMSEFVRYALP